MSRRTLLSLSAALPVATLVALPALAATAHKVEIRNREFTPRKITIKAGDSVTWKNSDSVVHTATDQGGGWDTGSLRRGKSATLTFDRPGTYNYVCTFHSGMIGKVVVKA